MHLIKFKIILKDSFSLFNLKYKGQLWLDTENGLEAL